MTVAEVPALIPRSPEAQLAALADLLGLVVESGLELPAVSVAMRKSPRVAGSRSSLVAR